MKWLSFKCRGLANPPKKLALKRLLSSEPCDIVFLLEILGSSELIIKALLGGTFKLWTLQGSLGDLPLGSTVEPSG